jgi:hypothetical protein
MICMCCSGWAQRWAQRWALTAGLGAGVGWAARLGDPVQLLQGPPSAAPRSVTRSSNIVCAARVVQLAELLLPVV